MPYSSQTPNFKAVTNTAQLLRSSRCSPSNIPRALSTSPWGQFFHYMVLFSLFADFVVFRPNYKFRRQRLSMTFYNLRILQCLTYCKYSRHSINYQIMIPTNNIQYLLNTYLCAKHLC